MTTENLSVEDVDAMNKGDLEKFVAEHDEIEVTGTGAGGNVLKTDLENAVKRYLEERAATDPEPADDEPAAEASEQAAEAPAEPQPLAFDVFDALSDEDAMLALAELANLDDPEPLRRFVDHAREHKPGALNAELLSAAGYDQDADVGDGDGEPADTDDAPAGDHVEVRLKIERQTDDGDWWDPFSGHAMHHSVDVCPVNGARRDGGEAVLLVPAEEADRYADR